MKYLVIFSLAFVFFSKGECFSDEEQEAIFKLHLKCQPISGVTDEIAQRAMAGDFPEDAAFKEHILCMSKGLGFFSESGEVNKEFVEAELTRRVADAALRDEIRSACVQQKATPQETAFHSAKCMYAYKDRIA